MQTPRRIAALLALALVGTGALATAMPSTPASAAPGGDDEVIAFEVRGVGNGHGRGLSQWGSYGRAIDGQSWQEILDAYYSNTEAGTATKSDLRVRLTPWDGVGTVGVISRDGKAAWNGSTAKYTSMYAVEVSPDRFEVYGATSGYGCVGSSSFVVPQVSLTNGDRGQSVTQMQQLLSHFGFSPGPIDGIFGNMTQEALEDFQEAEGLPVDGTWDAADWNRAEERLEGQDAPPWTKLTAQPVDGPVRFTTPVNQSSAGAANVLGVCEPDGSITHYRGSVEFLHTGDGNRVVNEVDIENYLRGVVPKESPASWGDAAGGAGMNALRAQSVAARSYALTQNRYSYASTCDTSSCQVYGGSAVRLDAATANSVRLEHDNTDEAIDDTGGVVRVWPGSGAIVSTEFSASNGPTTAGGSFPSVVDPWDDQPGNPNHRWTRIIDADAIRSRYGLGSANDVTTATDTDSPYGGIWANEVRLGNGTTVSAWDFRNAFGLNAPGFELVPIRRTVTDAVDFAFIGDSVGVSVAGSESSEFRVVTEDVFGDETFDAISSRRTQGGHIVDGVSAASDVPVGTDLVVVELGYNDDPGSMPARIDAVMLALRERQVGLVLWVNVSERRTSMPYHLTNAALDEAAAAWDELVVLDWNAASSHAGADRWYSDGVHLTSTGQAEFALWLRNRVLEIVADGYTPPRSLLPGQPLRIPVMGVGGVPAEGAGTDVVGVALNVTAVGPVGPGFLRVWACGSEEPETSSVNFVAAGAVEPNAVVVPVDESGEVCVSSLVETDVIVDVTAWFESGVGAASGRLVDTREGSRVAAGEVLRVPVSDRAGVPESGVVGVALNVTAVGPVGPGFLRVWACGSEEPETSSVNFVAAGAVEPNAVVVPVDESGEVCVSSLVETDVIVDVTAWFESGVGAASGRLVDTREGSRVAAGEVLRVPVSDRAGVPESGVVGVALNVTAVGPVGPGFLRVWACGSEEPETSSVNFVAAGAVEPNAVVVPVDESGEVCVSSLVETDVIVDVTAWFDGGLRSSPGERVVDTRYGVGPIPTR
ncbi:MAG: SpoIID/LytB domain-containing protein [Ilumatobacteraceae bacterium]|nr:SpoIID/LytB domain-containing protein [Ilumatobacteraceae bacterium]